MAYTTINKSTDYFNTKLYTGNGSTQSITGVGHQPDFIWIKNRDTTAWHTLVDVVRGTGKTIYSNRNDAEGTYSSTVSSFDNDGFTVGNSGDTNNNGSNLVSWNWKAGGGQGSSNTDGSINTTYTSVNTTAGFSISKYTGNNTAGATVGHGLGVTPKVVIIKRLDTTGSWISKFNNPTDGYFYLHANDAMSASSGWLPTSSTTFTLANQWTAYNASGGTYVAYCFAEKTGYSKFGYYTGNGNTDGTFVYTGFAPSWVMIKKTTAEDWFMVDNKREPINPLGVKFITANNETAEQTSSNKYIDFLSNGFKCRAGTGYHNDANVVYSYMAFGQSLVGSNNVPCTAK